MVSTNANAIPNATNNPNTCTGGIGVKANDANPTADVIDVNSMGRNKLPTTFSMVSRTLLPGLCSSANSDRICTESTTAMGIKKIGIIELMI